MAGSKGTFCIENCIERLTYWPAPKPGENYGLGQGPTPEVLDTGIKDFGATFPRRIHAFLEDVTNGVPREHLRSSGRDALATLEYIWAVIESYENGGALVRPHAAADHPRRSPRSKGSEGVMTMIKLGVNSVLFGGFDLATAMQHIAWAGYDGIELSAIKGMCEHLDLDNWQAAGRDDQAAGRRERPGAARHGGGRRSTRTGWPRPSRPARRSASRSINIGPGGKSDVEEDFAQPDGPASPRWPTWPPQYGVTLCCKAHVGRRHLQHAHHAARDGEDRVARPSAWTWTPATSTAPARTPSRRCAR